MLKKYYHKEDREREKEGKSLINWYDWSIVNKKSTIHFLSLYRLLLFLLYYEIYIYFLVEYKRKKKKDQISSTHEKQTRQFYIFWLLKHIVGINSSCFLWMIFKVKWSIGKWTKNVRCFYLFNVRISTFYIIRNTNDLSLAIEDGRRCDLDLGQQTLYCVRYLVQWDYTWAWKYNRRTATKKNERI